MNAYRFCRTDDIPLLVDAWNRCGLPHDPTAAPLTVAGFKQEIRELDLWCSSCMVGFEADEPVAVVIGCKRPPDTLVRRIAVHPDHLRKGHGRHLLTSLSAKLSILGPPRLVAEVPADNAQARALFEACGWEHDRTYYDLVLDGESAGVPSGAITVVTPDDLPDAVPSDDSQSAWQCARATVEKRRERIQGLALVSADRLEAGVLYTREAEEVAIWAVQTSGDGAPLSAIVRDVERRESKPAVLHGWPDRSLSAFRAIREALRFVTAAKPA
jgi:ribosomal protein S18 acetylase RimI-like enzyme